MLVSSWFDNQTEACRELPTRRRECALGQRALWGLVLIAMGLAGCGDDRDVEGDAVCRGNECQCPSTGDCRVDCAGACDLACTGSGDCNFSCGAECLATCPGSGLCDIAVGDQSKVECPGSGGCDVTCFGDCTVECPGSGTCRVQCERGFNCELARCDDAVTCPDGVQVCNGGCEE